MSDGSTAPAPAAPASAPAASEAPSQATEPNAEGGEPKASPEPKKTKEPPTPAKLRKLVIDGKEEVVDEEQVFRDYKKYKSGDKLLKEANLTKKQVGEFLKAFKENPRAVLSNPKLGVDLKKLAHEVLSEEIESELKDPRDIENEKLKKYYEESEAQKKSQKEEAEAKEWSESVAQQRESIAGELHKVMEATSLAKDTMTLRAAAYYMRQCLKQGIDVSPQDVVAHLEETHLKNYHRTASQYSGEQLMKFLGEEVVAKIRESDLQQLRTKRAEKAKQKERTDMPSPARRSGPPQFMDRYAASEMARKKLGL